LKKPLLLLATGALFAIVLSACSDSVKVEDAQIKLSTDSLDMSTWMIDGNHMADVKGTLLSGDKPVEGAVVQLANFREITTDKNGNFDFSIDRSKLDIKEVKVVSAENAKIDGKKVSKDDHNKLVGVSNNVAIRYPVIIDSVSTNANDASLVDVEAHAKMPEGQEFPGFGIDRYEITGTVKDADGNPVEGAVINIRRDGVEGFSISPPTDKDGKYQFFYLPDDEEAHYFYVVYNGTRYSLPENRIYMFPEDTSVNIDVMLPKTGTVIDDKPPTLVTHTLLGAHYTGLLFGLEVPDNVNYTVTIPMEEDGSFTVTLPKTEWEKKPTFYETIFNMYMEEGKDSGDTISSSDLAKPTAKDPSGIIATEK